MKTRKINETDLIPPFCIHRKINQRQDLPSREIKDFTYVLSFTRPVPAMNNFIIKSAKI